jgi:DNA-directed RNA polymerase subunit beta
LATYAKINKYGFIETPYRRVDKKAHRVLEESEYLSADMERTHIIAQANVRLDDEGVILDDFVVARHDGRNIMARKEDVDYIDVSPKQIVSIASACIPFLENDDTTRALMGANMQRQALPLIKPTAPLIGTGMEHIVARDSGLAVISTGEGVVSYVDSRRIVVKDSKKKTKTYQLQNLPFQPRNMHQPIAVVKSVKKLRQAISSPTVPPCKTETSPSAKMSRSPS